MTGARGKFSHQSQTMGDDWLLRWLNWLKSSKNNRLHARYRRKMRAHKQTLTREKSVNRIQPKMDPTPRENGIIWMSKERT